MSTTTNFKRIALVAVAALGLGVLSSVPTTAAINADTVTLSATTATQTTNETYTATSATVTVSFFGATADSMSITAALTSAPALNTALPTLQLIETSSAQIESKTVGTAKQSVGDTTAANRAVVVRAEAGTVVTTAKFAVYLARGVLAPTVVGSYGVKITPASVGASGALQSSAAVSLTITVTEDAGLSTKAVASGTLSQIVEYGSTYDPANVSTFSADSTVVGVKTASNTPKAVVFTKAKNAAGVVLTATGESLTASISGAGTLGLKASYPTSGTELIVGKSISMKQTDYLLVFADGNAGEGTITLTGSVSGNLIATEKITFSGDVATKFAASTIAATDSTVIGVGGTTKVSAIAQDAASYIVSGLTAGTDYYAFSSNTAVATVSVTGSTFSATTGYSAIVTGVSAGTTTIVFGNKSTLATSTFTSAPVTVRVGSGTPATMTVTTDKTTYAPGEKITMTVRLLDSTGLAVIGAASYANIFADTMTASATLSSGTLPIGGALTDYSNTTNSKVYTVYAPVYGASLVFSYKGGTGLIPTEQVAKTLTVTVTDSGAAALAAVTALATTVASLRTLIVTLTNLVLKIQKKVKA